MANLVVGLIILAILGTSIGVYVDQKRKGVKCVGCPMSGTNKSKKDCTCQIEF